MSAPENLFVKYRAKVTGPHTHDEIAAMVRKGTLSPIHRVSADQHDWRALHETEGWQHLWRAGAEAVEQKTSTTEPPPLPSVPQRSSQADDDPAEPVDVELLE